MPSPATILFAVICGWIYLALSFASEYQWWVVLRDCELKGSLAMGDLGVLYSG
jgi:hypothetical protein